MRLRSLVGLVLTISAFAQSPPKLAPQPESKSVTVPITIDHDRVIIDVGLPLPDGTTKRVHAWVDNGNPDLYLSRRLFESTGGSLSCDGQVCSGAPPLEVNIGGMTVPVGGRIPGSGIMEAKVPAGGAPIAPGLDADINLPSTVLRNYDVLINFPDHELTLASSGSLKFKGVATKVIVNSGSGLIQVPSQIENKKYDLALDLGSSISFLAEDLFDRLEAAHPGWPRMTGAVGPANLSGSEEETKWNLMRLDRLQFGPLFLTNVAVVDFPKDRMSVFQKRAATPTAGLLGANALINYRVGLDYAHSTVYFDIGRLFNFPDFDVIGLILRPEDDGRLTILGIADFDGKPSVAEIQAGDRLVAVDGVPVTGAALGQVWSMLGGEPGKERKLTVERNGKQFTVVAQVQHFLGETDENNKSKGKPRKK
jgi:Aspartyl protease